MTQVMHHIIRTTDTPVINDYYMDFLKHTEHSTVPKILVAVNCLSLSLLTVPSNIMTIVTKGEGIVCNFNTLSSNLCGSTQQTEQFHFDSFHSIPLTVLTPTP